MIEFLELTVALGVFLAPLFVVAFVVVVIVEGLHHRLFAANWLLQETQTTTRKGRSARPAVTLDQRPEENT